MRYSEEVAEAVEAIRRHARLFDTELQAVIATTVDGRIVHWSNAAEETYGWSREEVADRFINEVTPTALSRELAARILASLQAGRSWSGRFEVQSKSGEEFAVSVQDIPVRGVTGELIGIIGISTRVTAPQLQSAG